MASNSCSARITGPVSYVASGGRELKIPMGPCLLERGQNDQVEVIWGTAGENCAILSQEALKTAKNDGSLVLLD